MDADTTIDDDTQDETLPALRRSGYKFCAKPVDIQCYNYASQKVIANPAFGTCSVDIGFSCQVFCDDYKVRVACCYCPPKAVGKYKHSMCCTVAKIVGQICYFIMFDRYGY